MLRRVKLRDVLMYVRGNSIGTDDRRRTTDDGQRTTDDGRHTLNLSILDKPIGASPSKWKIFISIFVLDDVQ